MKDWDYPQMGEEAARKALADAKVKYSDIEQVKSKKKQKRKQTSYINFEILC